MTIRLLAELDAADVQITAAPPQLVSQKTSEAVLGIPRRAFLESLATYRAAGGEVIALGRLRLVHREAYVAHLAARTGATDETDDVAELVEGVGLRVVS